MLAAILDRAYRRRHPPRTLAEIRAEVLAEHEAIGDKVARRYVRGNINIKAGDYSDTDTIPRKRAIGKK